MSKVVLGPQSYLLVDHCFLIIVVFVGLPVVDHMDDGIGCFVRACEREVKKRSCY